MNAPTASAAMSASTEAAANVALSVRGVSHRFGETLALDNVSIEVLRGQFVVLLGLNGAGKSTLFSLVTRLYDNVSGEIRILGHDVRRASFRGSAAAWCGVPVAHAR